MHVAADGQWGIFTYCRVHAVGIPTGRDDKQQQQTAPLQTQTDKESTNEETET